VGQAVHAVHESDQINVGRALVCTGKHRTGVGLGWLWIGPGPGI